MNVVASPQKPLGQCDRRLQIAMGSG
jgi:hypothetical protein